MKPHRYIAVVDENGQMNGRSVLCSNLSVSAIEKEIMAMAENGEVDPEVPVVIFEMKKTVSVQYKAELVSE